MSDSIMEMAEGSVLDWDFMTLAKAYKEKKVTPTEVVQMLINRIKVRNEKVNAFITVCFDHAMNVALKAEKEIMNGNIRSPLHGIPIGLKDLIFTKGIKTTMGSGVYKDFVPDYDAAVVTQLKQAGAVIIGKLNTHELAYGPTGDDSYFGPVYNPYNISKIAGGSSGGSAAAVADSLCYASIGTDTGGSIRIPSSCCGIVGMKPTYGLVSNDGIYPLSHTLDHAGPMTKSVMDNAVMLSYLADSGKKDDGSILRVKKDYTHRMGQKLEGCTIGIPLYPFLEKIDEEVKKGFLKSIQKYKELGVIIKFIEIENLNEVIEACDIITAIEAYFINKSIAEHPLLGEETRKRILQGTGLRAAEYIKALQVKTKFIKLFDRLLNDVDVIVTPTIPMLPTNIGQKTVNIANKEENVRAAIQRMTCLSNITGFPSLSLPCAISSSGLPVGIQLIGKRFDEANLYRFGYALEQVIDLNKIIN
ncbi:amidase [Scopulibacillus cellulosilyticus]|uniref:Amidase n=1 Tax=Scopulibacillus cellulosilyticus TaxID=2665665 RepID=A0ABW2PST3_9BACL